MIMTAKKINIDKTKFMKVTSGLMESLSASNLLFKFKEDKDKEGYVKLFHETTLSKLKEILNSGLKMNKGTLWATDKLNNSNNWMYGDIALEFYAPEKYCHKVNNTEYHIYHDIPKSDFIAIYTMSSRTEKGKDKLINELELNESLEKPLYKFLIEKGFKFTNKVPKGASYLMPDGMFLSMQENEKLLNPIEETGKATHPDLDYYLYDNEYVGENDANRALVKTDNAIRLNDGTNFKEEKAVISLPELPLTEEQYEQLMNWLYNVMYISESVDVGDEITDKFDTYKFISPSHNNGYLPDDIIKLIRKRYKDLEEKYYPQPQKLYNLDNEEANWPEDAEDFIYWGSEADKWAEEYAKSYKVKMSPKDFFDLTTIQGADALKKDDYVGLGKLRDLDIDEFTKERWQPIFLCIAFRDPKSPQTAQVTGHEGRHRMWALMNAGIKSVDVELKCDSYNTEYDKHKPFKLNKINLIGQFNKNVKITINNPIAMSWKQHKAIRPNLKDENLNESIKRKSNFVITTSPYEAKRIIDTYNSQCLRIFIDEKIGVYLIGRAWDVTHMDMIEEASEDYPNLDYEVYDLNQISIIYVPEEQNDFESPDDLVADNYFTEYGYKGFSIWAELQKDFSNFELYKILGKPVGIIDYSNYFEEEGFGVDESLIEKIIHLSNGKWQVQSEDGSRNLGTYDTKTEAEKRLKQIHYFKHLNEKLDNYIINNNSLGVAWAYIIYNYFMEEEIFSVAQDMDVLTIYSDDYFYSVPWIYKFNDDGSIDFVNIEAAYKESIEKEEVDENNYPNVEAFKKDYGHYDNIVDAIEQGSNPFGSIDMKKLKEYIEENSNETLEESFESKEFKLGTAGFIKEDGTFLYADEVEDSYHGGFEKDILDKKYPEFSNTHPEEDTCVRIYKEPNEIQYKKLEEIIDAYLDTEDYCKVEIWKNNKPDFYKIFTLHEGACEDYQWDENVGNWTGYKLVQIIKNYFNNNINESLLLEKKRTELISKSKRSDDYSKRNQFRGRNRWERRKYSKISTSVADYNKIDMNAFWKGDILEFGIKVQGETDNYVVTVIFEKILERLRREIEYNKNKLEFKCILRALINTFNSEDVYIHCTCPDFTYRQAYWATRGGYNSGTPQPSNGKWIANPGDTKGAGCKHVNLILANMTWMMKIASVINNYIWYCKDNMELNYAQYIFPKLYGMDYDKAIQLTLFDTDELTSDEETINLSNALGRKRTQFKPRGVEGGNPRFERPKVERENPRQLKLDLEEPNEEEIKVEEES